MRTTPAPLDPNPGPPLEDDDQSEASSIESTPLDALLSGESDIIENLRENKDFVCKYLTEGCDKVIDLTEILIQKWKKAFKADICIFIDQAMIWWNEFHNERL